MIQHPHGIVDPGTVMIEFDNAPSSDPIMMRPRGFVIVTTGLATTDRCRVGCRRRRAVVGG